MSGAFAAAPALPLHTAGKYVAGAYIVFLALVLVYVAIMAVKLSRTERELVELRRDLVARGQDAGEGAGTGEDAGAGHQSEDHEHQTEPAL